MKKNMVKHLFDLYLRFDPNFQAIMEVEYPKLSEAEQLQLLKLLSEDFHGVVKGLRNMETEGVLAAA